MIQDPFPAAEGTYDVVTAYSFSSSPVMTQLPTLKNRLYGF
jgi:hypothetical protein